MNRARTAGLYIGGLAIVTAAACGKQSSPADGDLARDLAAAKGAAPGLELAPRSGNSLVVVSAIEGGPAAAARRAVAPAPHVTPSRAAPQPVAPIAAPVPARAPSSAVGETPSAPRPTKTSERAPDPAPLPAASGGKAPDRGASTEAEIFRRMPWIRP